MDEKIRELSRSIEPLCRRHHVRRLELFGSAVGEAFHAGISDLDFLVEFESLEGGQYSEHYFGLLEDLTDLFGRPVDLLVLRAVRNPYFLESINRSRELLYVA